MVELIAEPGGGILEDTDRRDVLTAGDGTDTIVISRDGKTDSVIGLDDGTDLIDLSDFNVTWAEVEVKYKGGNDFIITIRGERTKITFEDPDVGSITQSSLTADDFIFAVGAAEPLQNIILETQANAVAGVENGNLMLGTDQSDIFILAPDNTRDVVKYFDPTKDKIDLTAFGKNFEELQFVDKAPGKVVVKLSGDDVVIRDLSNSLTASDLTADMFILTE